MSTVSRSPGRWLRPSDAESADRRSGLRPCRHPHEPSSVPAHLLSPDSRPSGSAAPRSGSVTRSSHGEFASCFLRATTCSPPFCRRRPPRAPDGRRTRTPARPQPALARGAPQHADAQSLAGLGRRGDHTAWLGFGWLAAVCSSPWLPAAARLAVRAPHALSLVHGGVASLWSTGTITATSRWSATTTGRPFWPNVRRGSSPRRLRLTPARYVGDVGQFDAGATVRRRSRCLVHLAGAVRPCCDYSYVYLVPPLRAHSRIVQCLFDAG